MIRKSLVALALTLALAASLGWSAFADNSNTKSVIGDYFNKVFDIKPTDGATALETDQDVKERESINSEIFRGAQGKTYSLYDRFGGNISFVPYFGETKISTNLMDRFYTKFANNDTRFKLSPDDILKMLESPALSNNVVYEGRANVLSSERIEAGAKDPRVNAYSGVSAVGGSAALGNTMLSISNTLTTVVGYLSGGGLYRSIDGVWQKACSAEVKTLLQSIVKFFLPVALIIFTFRLVTQAFGIIKGSFSLKSFAESTLGAAVSIGLIFALMVNPQGLSSAVTGIVTAVDGTLDSMIQLGESEIVKSDVNKNVRVAALWERNVFEPWCNGMFGSDYSNLYTQYDTNAAHGKMPQDHDDVKTSWTNGKVRYNSSALTGDVKIPLGNGNDVRNWAALAWSTQSVYHIDAVDAGESNVTKAVGSEPPDGFKQRNVWPKASTTPMNDQIFVDNFRWLDAKLNISPEYRSVDSVRMSYSNSNSYDQSFVSEGFRSLYMSMLMIPLAVLTVRKIGNVVKVVTIAFSFVWRSLANLMAPARYSLANNLSEALKPLYDFIWWSLCIFLGIKMYTLLVGGNALSDAVWIFIGVYLCRFRPIRTPRQLAMAIQQAKTGAQSAAKSFTLGAERFIGRGNQKKDK